MASRCSLALLILFVLAVSLRRPQQVNLSSRRIASRLVLPAGSNLDLDMEEKNLPLIVDRIALRDPSNQLFVKQKDSKNWIDYERGVSAFGGI